MALTVRKPPINAGDTGSVSGWGRSLAGGHGNSLQYSCLENPMDRGDWRATVHQVAKSQIQLKLLSMQTQKAKLIYVLEGRMWLLMHERGFSFVQNQKKQTNTQNNVYSCISFIISLSIFTLFLAISIKIIYFFLIKLSFKIYES